MSSNAPVQGIRPSSQHEYYYAYVVLLGIETLVLLPVTALGLIKSRARRDPSRKFVPWLKASLVFFTIATALYFIFNLLVLLINKDVVNDNGEMATADAVYYISFHVDLFTDVAAALIMVLLLQLGPGMRRILDGENNGVDRAFRWAAITVATVVICLALAFFGLYVDFKVNHVAGYSNNPLVQSVTDSKGIQMLQTIDDLKSANRIILWAASLVISSLSVYIFTRARFSPQQSTSILYLSASALNLLSSTWRFVHTIIWLLGRTRTVQAPYVALLRIILSSWPTGAVLIICYIIALRNRSSGGVWSQSDYASYKGRSSREY